MQTSIVLENTYKHQLTCRTESVGKYNLLISKSFALSHQLIPKRELVANDTLIQPCHMAVQVTILKDLIHTPNMKPVGKLLQKRKSEQNHT